MISDRHQIQQRAERTRHRATQVLEQVVHEHWPNQQQAEAQLQEVLRQCDLAFRQARQAEAVQLAAHRQCEQAEAALSDTLVAAAASRGRVSATSVQVLTPVPSFETSERAFAASGAKSQSFSNVVVSIGRGLLRVAHSAFGVLALPETRSCPQCAGSEAVYLDSPEQFPGYRFGSAMLHCQICDHRWFAPLSGQSYLTF